MRPNLRGKQAVLLGLVLLILVLGYFAGKRSGGSANDKQAAFFDIQRDHLRRLDGASVEGRVVFLGSSTFQGLDTSSVTPIGLNLSIGGDTLEGLIERSAAYRSLATARVVIVNIGLNDLMRGCVQPKVRIEDLLQLVRAETPIVVLGVQGVEEAGNARPCDGRLAGLIDEFNQDLLNACSNRNNCQFVPHPVTTNMNKNTMKPLQEPDGVHLSRRGYQALSDALRNALAKVDASLATVQ